MRRAILAAALALALAPVPAVAEEPAAPTVATRRAIDDPTPPVPGRPFPERSPWARLELRADLLTLVHFKNDSDFDRSEPTYNPSGQTVGALANIFRPRATLHILDTLRITYEVELGLNFWSKNNPDQQNALSGDIFVLKHREIFGEAEFRDGRYGMKVGYTRYRDPTGLFVDHWIGMAQAWLSWGEGRRLGLFGGQVPDQVYEGLVLDENNFKRDIWLVGGRLDLAHSRSWRLSAAVTSLVDTHLVQRERWLVAPSLHVEGSAGPWGGFVDAVLQAGQETSQVGGARDALILAWALQAQLRLALPKFELRITGLALSPDDSYDGNDANRAFLYSGKSRSATLMLTEDEIRDWYTNLDERAGRYQGGFFQNRAGWFVADAIVTLRLHDRIRPSLVVGAATVLKPANALGGTLVGVETDFILEIKISDYLIGHVVVGGLFPGSAGAALINRIDNRARDYVVMSEASLLLRY